MGSNKIEGAWAPANVNGGETGLLLKRKIVPFLLKNCFEFLKSNYACLLSFTTPINFEPFVVSRHRSTSSAYNGGVLFPIGGLRAEG